MENETDNHNQHETDNLYDETYPDSGDTGDGNPEGDGADVPAELRRPRRQPRRRLFDDTARKTVAWSDERADATALGFSDDDFSRMPARYEEFWDALLTAAILRQAELGLQVAGHQGEAVGEAASGGPCRFGGRIVQIGVE